MSYDLTCFPVPAGMSVAEAYEALVEREEAETSSDDWLTRPVPETARAETEQLAALLQQRFPELERFVPDRPLPWIELNATTCEMQATIHHGSVALTMPYFRADARTLLALAAGCLHTLGEEAGYAAWDPQLDRAVTANDLGEMTAHYRKVDGMRPSIEAQVAASVRKKPWWKFW